MLSKIYFRTYELLQLQSVNAKLSAFSTPPAVYKNTKLVAGGPVVLGDLGTKLKKLMRISLMQGVLHCSFGIRKCGIHCRAQVPKMVNVNYTVC